MAPLPSIMPSRDKVFLVTFRMTDFEYAEDADTEVRSVHATLQSANQAARDLHDDQIFEYGLEDEPFKNDDWDEDDAAFYEEWWDHDDSVPYVWEHEQDFDSLVTFRIEVVEKTVLGGPNCGPHGFPMITIPEGKPLLRGAKFFFAGELKHLGNASAKAAVKAYNGKVVENEEEADYAVMGENATEDQLIEINLYAVEKINEGFFLLLVRHGLPANKVLINDRLWARQHARLQELSANATLPPGRVTRAPAEIFGQDQENVYGPPAKRMRM